MVPEKQRDQLPLPTHHHSFQRVKMIRRFSRNQDLLRIGGRGKGWKLEMRKDGGDVGALRRYSTGCRSRASRQMVRRLELDGGVAWSTRHHSIKTGANMLRVFHREFRSSASMQAVLEFKLADIGEGIAEVEIMQWHVKEGDEVSQFDLLCSVQSDKATVEITSRYDGVIKKLNWQEGEMAKVGQTLVEIEAQEDETTAAAPMKSPAEQSSPSPVTSAPVDEKIEKQARFAKGQRAYSVEPFLTPLHSTPSAVHVPQNDPMTSHETSSDGRVLTTPAVRRLAREHTIDLNQIQGTGKQGRILKEDVLAFISNRSRRAAISQTVTAEATSGMFSPSSSKPQPTGSLSTGTEQLEGFAAVQKLTADETTSIKGIQKMMHVSMTKSLAIPHFNYMDEIEVDELIALRKSINASVSGKQRKLSYMPIIIKAISLSLHHFPALNSHYHVGEGQGGELLLTKRKDHHIGVAMDTSRGLLVPVIKNCEELSIQEISDELNRLQGLGKENRLGENDLTGATFTVSNIGSIGGTYMSPIIAQPQVAILAIGRMCSRIAKLQQESDTEPVFVESQAMNFSYAADHRVIDGAMCARFSNKVKSFLENPTLLLTELR